MEPKNEQFIILEQYRIYSEAKEKFVDRQFATNRFYLIINLIILLTAYFLSTFVPQQQPVIVLSFVGVASSIMWWMNIDSYQILIKVKYANVLEYLETKLPEQPYHKEFVDYQQMKKKMIIFGDFQKNLALAIAAINALVCGYNAFTMWRYMSLS